MPIIINHKLNQQELQSWVIKINEGKSSFLPNQYTHIEATVKNDVIVLKNIAYIAKGKLTDDNNIVFDIKLKPIFKLLVALFILMLLAFLISDQVTINSINNPSILSRITFVLLGLILGSFAVILLIKTKRSFIELIKKELT